MPPKPFTALAGGQRVTAIRYDKKENRATRARRARRK